MVPTTTDMLTILKGLPRDGSEYIFHGPDGEKLKDISGCFKGALKRAGIRSLFLLFSKKGSQIGSCRELV
jgi:hypothetical protein